MLRLLVHRQALLLLFVLPVIILAVGVAAASLHAEVIASESAEAESNGSQTARQLRKKDGEFDEDAEAPIEMERVQLIPIHSTLSSKYIDPFHKTIPVSLPFTGPAFSYAPGASGVDPLTLPIPQGFHPIAVSPVSSSPYARRLRIKKKPKREESQEHFTHAHASHHSAPALPLSAPSHMYPPHLMRRPLPPPHSDEPSHTPPLPFHGQVPPYLDLPPNLVPYQPPNFPNPTPHMYLPQSLHAPLSPRTPLPFHDQVPPYLDLPPSLPAYNQPNLRNPAPPYMYPSQSLREPSTPPHSHEPRHTPPPPCNDRVPSYLDLSPCQHADLPSPVPSHMYSPQSRRGASPQPNSYESRHTPPPPCHDQVPPRHDLPPCQHPNLPSPDPPHMYPPQSLRETLPPPNSQDQVDTLPLPFHDRVPPHLDLPPCQHQNLPSSAPPHVHPSGHRHEPSSSSHSHEPPHTPSLPLHDQVPPHLELPPYHHTNPPPPQQTVKPPNGLPMHHMPQPQVLHIEGRGVPYPSPLQHEEIKGYDNGKNPRAYKIGNPRTLHHSGSRNATAVQRPRKLRDLQPSDQMATPLQQLRGQLQNELVHDEAQTENQAETRRLEHAPSHGTPVKHFKPNKRDALLPISSENRQLGLFKKKKEKEEEPPTIHYTPISKEYVPLLEFPVQHERPYMPLPPPMPPKKVPPPPHNKLPPPHMIPPPPPTVLPFAPYSHHEHTHHHHPMNGPNMLPPPPAHNFAAAAMAVAEAAQASVDGFPPIIYPRGPSPTAIIAAATEAAAAAAAATEAAADAAAALEIERMEGISRLIENMNRGAPFVPVGRASYPMAIPGFKGTYRGKDHSGSIGMSKHPNEHIPWVPVGVSQRHGNKNNANSHGDTRWAKQHGKSIIDYTTNRKRL